MIFSACVLSLSELFVRLSEIHSFRFGVGHNGRVLLADEMGLGKSIQALGIARYYGNEWPLLIVCPSSVKGAWRKVCHQVLTVLIISFSSFNGSCRASTIFE